MFIDLVVSIGQAYIICNCLTEAYLKIIFNILSLFYLSVHSCFSFSASSMIDLILLK